MRWFLKHRARQLRRLVLRRVAITRGRGWSEAGNPGHGAAPPITRPQPEWDTDHRAQDEVSPKAAGRDARAEWAIRLEERHHKGHGDKHEHAEAANAVAIDERRVAIGDGMAP